jgi:cell division protein FtsL
MLSLKRKSEAQPVAAPRWHTNFRNFEKLPDTKVVRTAFFINTAAVALAVAAAMWLGNQEYTNYTIRQQIALTEADIEANKKQNADATRLSKQFAEETKKFDEAAAFMRTPITPLEYAALIGQTMPREVLIDFLETKTLGDNPKVPTVYQLRGRVAGSPDQASGTASQYVDTLRADPRLSDVFESIQLNKINRDASGGFLAFEILLTVKVK